MPNRAAATIGGEISDVRVMTSRNPKPGRPNTFAFFQIEDLDSTMRCVVWADAYAKYSEFVRNETVVFLRGRVDKKESNVENEDGEREMEVTFFVDEIIPYENAVSQLSRGAAVVLKEEVAQSVGIRTLYDVMRTYRNGRDGNAPGADLEIWLELRNGTRATFKCSEFKINLCNEMRARVEASFGERSFRLLPAPVKSYRSDERRNQHWRKNSN